MYNQHWKEVRNPLIISRSYYGNVEYIIKAKDDAGFDILDKMTDAGHKIANKRPGKFQFTDSLDSKKQISFSITEPIVFAFELSDIGKISTELSGEMTQYRRATIAVEHNAY